MTDPVLQIFNVPQNGGILALPQNNGVSNANGGKAEAPILSFSNVYQGAAELLKNAQQALGHFEEQLSDETNVQPQSGRLSDGVGEQTLVGQLLGLVEGNQNPHDLAGVVVGERTSSSHNLSGLDELSPIIENDDALKRIPVVHSGVNNLQEGPERNETIQSLIVSIAGSYTASAQPSTSIAAVNSLPTHQSPEPLLSQGTHSAPQAQQTYLAPNQQQGVTVPERDSTNVIQSLQQLGLVNDPKSERLVQQASHPSTQRLVPFDFQIEKGPQVSAPVDPSLLRNQPPVTPIPVLGTSQQAVPSPLTINGGLSPVSGEGTQGQIAAESEIRLGGASIKSVQLSQGEVGSSGSETFSGHHPNGGMTSSADSHQGNSSNMNQGQSQSQSALRVSTFEERLQAYHATAPQRLQIDVQLSETARVQVDVAVQQRQVYAGLLMDQPILRNLALQHVPQLEEQLNQNGMELQEFDVQVDQQEQRQREVFEDVPHASRFGSEPEEDPVDLVKKDLDMASDRERGFHFVA